MKRQKDEEGGQEWLNTYADMITLVLTFFVLLYSISNVNLTKLEEVASAMQRQLGIEAKTEIEDVPSDLKYPVVGEGAQAPEDAEAPLQQTQQQYQASAREMADMARDIQTYFDSENLDAVVSNSENAVYIRFKNDLLFAPDNANLTDASKSMLDAVGIRRVVVAGGETSGAVTKRLGFSSYKIGASVAPGVPVMVPMENEALRLVLKSGNFGQEDFFVRVLEMTQTEDGK